MATVYKVHPAIGIARVGNSPAEFFIGQERVGQEPTPSGGFKDAQCRVKRQAARFRIYAHHDDGTVAEITNAEAEITWTVHLVNKKAANPGRGNTESAADLTIDPGSRTIVGPNQQQLFDDGMISFSGVSAATVPLGEIRSDPQSHLLVLGGFGTSASPPGSGISSFWGNDDWYDDVSDGPVTATIKLRTDNSTPAVVGAWIVVGPPKFAPHQDSVITLYDRVLDAMVAGGLATAPTTTSYSNDIYPILQRARDTRWVAHTFGAHTWPDPVTTDALRHAIFNRLRAPGGGGGDMPDLNESSTSDGRLTSIQYAHMERWSNDNYTNDWGGVPPPQAAITPEDMERAALEACVGGAFFPGIEGGGLDASQRPMLVAGNYLEAFRLNHSVVAAGDLTFVMALPWQADFNACADNWWPVPRPNYVIPQGTSAEQPWSRGIGNYEDMVAKWHTLGFVVRQGAQHVEVERCDTGSITLLTPLLNFQNVPQGPMGMVREVALAISFEVISPSNAVTLEYAPGGAPAHPQLTAFNTSVTTGPTPANGVATARLWVIYRTSNPNDVLPPQTLTLQDSGGTQSWTVMVTGNTVARTTAAAALVLDRSGSMSQDRGDGLSKHVSLQQAASIFVDVMLEGDGVGVVRFNQDAQVLESIVPLGNGGLSDINRSNTKDIINGTDLNPSGETSIGDGIFEGRSILTAATTPFDVNALVVLTDGVENRSRMIADVSSEISEFTYAVGLGQPQNISVSALQTISGNNGGYLLVTGPIGTDNRFMLQKYFLQILAGISNAQIVLDPSGQIVPGRVERVPFQLTSADSGVDVILLTPNTKIVDFRLQTPNGLILEPWRAMSEPGMRFVLSDGVTYYRLALPTELVANRFDGPGTWQALLTIGRPRLERSDSPDGADRSIVREMFAAPRVPRLTRGRSVAARRQTVLAAERATAAASGPVGTTVAAAEAPRMQPYSLVVHTYSNLSLQAGLEQASFEPGARLALHASVAESGIPLGHRTQVWAEVRRPNGSTATLAFTEHEDGQFAADYTTAMPGVYQFRVRAHGRTTRGEVFTREQTLTAGVWRGGDRPSDQGGAGQVIVDYLRDHDARLCALLKCVLERGGVIDIELEKRLQNAGVDLDRFRKCLEAFCRRV
jgi:hypothetical protein